MIIGAPKVAPAVEPGLPRLRPMYGIRSFGANTKCCDIHRGPLPEYTVLYCEACSRTGAAIEARIRLIAAEMARLERYKRERQRSEQLARIKAQRQAAVARKRNRGKVA